MSQPFHLKRMLQDQRIVQAKALIRETIQEYQHQFMNKPASIIRDITPELTQHAAYRGAPLFFPYVSSGLGKGAKVLLTDGSIKLDFINGIGAHFGHSLDFLQDASIDAALEDTIMQGNLQQNERSFELMKLLLDVSQKDHCILTSSGAMANENGLKLMFHYRPGATRIMAFENCFMGRTITLAQITDKAVYRHGLPTTIHVDYIPFYDPQSPTESRNAAIHAIETLIMRYPNQYAGLCMELVQGEGGYNVGDEGFFKAIIDTVKTHHMTVLVDEVQTFGRTSELFASQHFNILNDVDIITIGKLSQVCATIYAGHLVPKPGLISQTYTASTTAIECGYHIITHLLNNGYFGSDGRNMVLGNFFTASLQKLAKTHSGLHGPYGIGGMVAMTPLHGERSGVMDFLMALFHNGLMGFTTGRSPLRIRFLLPLGAVTKADIEEAITIIDRSLYDVSR